MILWRNNRLDARYELPNEELATQFMASRYYRVDSTAGMPISRALLNFIAGPIPEGGLLSVFEVEDPSFMQIVDLVIDRLMAERRYTARERVRK